MVKEENVIYRKGLSKEELLKAREKTEKEHVKSHANKSAFAGFMLFTVISKLMGASGQFAIILGAVGSALGGFLGHLEASARSKKLKAQNDRDREYKELNS